MPIYEYRCASCGFQKDYLQKVSDPVLSVCPACGKATFAKQLTAAGFQLKGSGWYATDFKNSGAAKPAAKADDGSKPEGKTESTPDAKTETKTDAKTETKTDSTTATKPDTKTGTKTGTTPPATPSTGTGS